MNLELKAGQWIQIIGPAKVRVLEGKISLLGTELVQNNELIIQSGKYFPFEIEVASKIELLGEDLKYLISNTPLIPSDRKKLAEKIENFPHPVKIMLLGQVDTGKTTLICYLANYFFNKGNQVAVIDLDAGQQDIGPPTTINLGILNKHISKLNDIPLNRMVFIGKTSPKGRMLQIMVGARELLDYALTLADIILIDTTGWVFGGAARAFKSAKIHALKPQILVALQEKNELTHILKSLEFINIQIELLSVYPHIQKRDHKTRKFLRESAFNKYFENASAHLLDLEQVRIENSIFKSGHILSEEEQNFIEKTLESNFIYAEKAPDSLFLVKTPASYYQKQSVNSVKEYFGVQEIHIVNKNDETGLLVGLLDKELNTLGIGLIEQIFYKENKIRIFTPIQNNIAILQFGFLKITKTGQELPDQDISF